jgi:DNA polymerase-3 subunit delta'
MLYPWHDALWQRLSRERLPHALLLAGPAGMGKAAFALELAYGLLCDQPDQAGRACGGCKACHLLRAGTHPDLARIAPEESGKVIKIDQIRALIAFFGLTSNYGGYQVAILSPAEAMNHNAANSLLKLLEEPPAKSLLILLSHQPARLPATVRSRCQRLDFRPDEALGRAWLAEQVNGTHDPELLLELSAGAPLAALELAGHLQKRRGLLEALKKLLAGQAEPVALAAEWAAQGAGEVLYWLNNLTMDLIRCAMSGQTVNRDLRDALYALAQQVDTRKLFVLLEWQMDCQRLWNGGFNVKDSSLLESVALHWLELGRERRKTR